MREARQNEMRAMEALPGVVAAAIGENATNLAATSVLRYFQSVLRQIGDPNRAALATVRKLRDLEAGELAVFAGEFKGLHKLPLPHVAANATVLRYGSIRSRRRVRAGMIRGFGLA